MNLFRQQWKKILILCFIFGSNLSFAKDKVVVVLDTGLDLKDPRFTSLCKYGHRDFTGKGITDHNGHGTHVLGLIEQYGPKEGYCTVIVKYVDQQFDYTNAYEKAFGYILMLHPDYVNISGGSKGAIKKEYDVIQYLNKTKFIVATGNDGLDLSQDGNEFYPASYTDLNNITPVGNKDQYGQRYPSSNYGLPYIRYEMGVDVTSTVPGGYGQKTGTSMSCAVATGKIIKEDIDKSK